MNFQKNTAPFAFITQSLLCVTDLISSLLGVSFYSPHCNYYSSLADFYSQSSRIYHFNFFNYIPIEGHIYQIRRIIPDFTGKYGSEEIALNGIFGKWYKFKSLDGKIIFEEVHFRKNRFREIYHDDGLFRMIKNNLSQEVNHYQLL